MKFSFPSSKQQKKNEKQQQEKVILFVCVENAGRSQIAEGFFNRKYVPKGYRAVSAGTRPVSHINIIAVEVMKEVGIDISSSQKPKIITEDMIKSSEKSVNMGCIDKTEDPKGKPIEKVREIRDEIDRRVKEIAQSLERQNSS